MHKNTYIEKEKTIDIIDDVDVLVIGGGPAGIGASVGAAKSGASVMIIEATGSFGGMWTNGLVITLAGFNSWLRPYRRCVGGIMGEWLSLAAEKGGAENNRSWVLNSDPEIMKVVADEMLLHYKVKCLLHTWMADVMLENNRIQGVLIENVDGRKAILAKTIIDCTGNGDVMARAGVSFAVAPELQPMTMAFYLAEVHSSGKIPFEEELVIPFGPEPGFLREPLLSEYTSRRRDVHVDRKKMREDVQKGKLPLFGGPWFGGLRKNYPWVNTTRIYGSAIDAASLTNAEMEGRKNVHETVKYYQKECDGFQYSWLMKTASTIGIRETRRLQGVYTLTKDDIVSCRTFEDTIALGAWPIDVHPAKGESGMHEMYVPLPYQIPFRALLPRTIENLIVAGRCISSDREAMGSIRVGATCGAIGHAAGVAAAWSVKSGEDFRRLNCKKIQQEIMAQGGVIEV